MTTPSLNLTLNTRMMAAIIGNDAKAIKAMRDAGVDLAGRNIDGDTWLDVAVTRNKKTAAAAILMLGGSKTSMLSATDKNGDTVLDKAVGVVSDSFLNMLRNAMPTKRNLALAA